jgi:hypothetical protein
VYCLADTIFPEGSAAEGLLSRGYVSREKHVPPPSGLHAMKEGTDVEIEVRGKGVRHAQVGARRPGP